MPYSDLPPPSVIPPTKAARDWLIGEGWKQEYATCPIYQPCGDVAVRGKAIVYECKRRSPFGDRAHNWCFRCPAGFMVTRQHVYDAGMERDRSMRVL